MLRSPLSWRYFEVRWEGRDALLEWVFESGDSVQYFQIERTVDKKIFEVIGEMPVKEAIDAYQNYQFKDERLDQAFPAGAGELISYRIKGITTNGTFHYSPIQSLIVGEVSPTLDLMPNPAMDHLTIYLPPIDKEWRYLRILDGRGNQILAHTIRSEDPKSLHLDLTEWGKGVYYVEMQSEDYSVSKKLVVK